MSYHRGLVFCGVALITGGAVALAAQQGYIDRDWLAGAWRLWPLILVAIGVSILASRTRFAIVGTIVAALVVGSAGGALLGVGPGAAACGGSELDQFSTEQGSFRDAAQVTLDFSCGTLVVDTFDGSQWGVATGQGGDPARITADPESLNVESSPDGSWWSGGRQHWLVDLPPATTYQQLEVLANAADTNIGLGGGRFTSVSLNPNAGSLTLDLANARIDNLNLSLNAGSASITVADGADVTGSVSANAGSIELCTEGALAIMLTVDSSVAFSHNLDGSGLGRDGNTWSLVPSYPASTVVSYVNLHIKGNAASFTLNPEGGCS